VQAASWGHPQTTGLPTIDAYLSAQALEPPAAESHYTERLVRLAHLGVCIEPSTQASIAPDLAALGLPADAPLLLCPGMPFKYSPAHDRLWIEIARRTPQARLVFFRSALAEALAARLKRRFEQEGLTFERHVTFIPFLDRARFLGLMGRASLFLDTVGFSGFNTALQAIECGLPVLTMEGTFLRGRLASGLLRHIGLDELVATDEDGFIGLAVRLASDVAAQQRLRAEISSRRHALFGDAAPLRDLERFLSDAAGVPTGRSP
jgi:predicted O-linked N-acetylglucosamine transferase (SPINDLY family)